MPADANGIYKSAPLPYFLQASLRQFKKRLDALKTTILANHCSCKRAIGECEGSDIDVVVFPLTDEAFLRSSVAPSVEATRHFRTQPVPAMPE